MGEVQSLSGAGPYRVGTRGFCAISNERGWRVQRGDDACRQEEAQHLFTRLVTSSRNGYDKIVRAVVEPASKRTIESSIRIYNVNGRLRNMRIRLTAFRPRHQPRPAPPATSKDTRRPRSMFFCEVFRDRAIGIAICTGVLADRFYLRRR